MLNRRDFGKATLAGAVTVALPPMQSAGGEIRVWMMDDCDYVAARSGEEALEWYRKWLKGAEVEEVLEVGDDVDFREGDAHDETLPIVTAREVIDRRIANGEPFPCYLCTDGHYC